MKLSRISQTKTRLPATPNQAEGALLEAGASQRPPRNPSQAPQASAKTLVHRRGNAGNRQQTGDALDHAENGSQQGRHRGRRLTAAQRQPGTRPPSGPPQGRQSQRPPAADTACHTAPAVTRPVSRSVQRARSAHRAPQNTRTCGQVSDDSTFHLRSTLLERLIALTHAQILVSRTDDPVGKDHFFDPGVHTSPADGRWRTAGYTGPPRCPASGRSGR